MHEISLAIETSCRAGGVAMGQGDELLTEAPLGDSGRHAAALLPTCQSILAERSLSPADVGSLYISVGPGSFTGLRVGITVARTWAQQQPGLILTAVPTALAVAMNVIDEPWEHLGVLLASKENQAYGALVGRDAEGGVELLGEPAVMSLQEHLAGWPKDVVLSGEALGFLENPGQPTIGEERWFPTAGSVWRVGRAMQLAGKTVDWPHLLPVYARQAEAVRLWEKKHGSEEK